MEHRSLSPLATASRDLVVKLSEGADPQEIESGCRELLTQNTNGMGSVDTRVVDVAGEIVRGVLAGVVHMRTPSIEAATRGVSDTGPEGPAGDADRLLISTRIARDVRDSDHASGSDYRSALKGAAEAARMTPDELRLHVDESDPRRPRQT
jgi:hypothetical protein